MNSSATTPPTTKNERWSTNVNDSCLAYNKKINSSDRLRKILDFGGGKHTRTRTRSQSLALQEEEEERKEPSSHPAISFSSRRSSIDSSISSLGDSISSFGTATAGPIFKPATTKNKNTSRSKKNKNTLLQYSTILSDSLSSFGSIHKNDRWRSSSKSSNSNNNNNNDRWKSSTASSKVSVRYPTHQKSNNNMLSLINTTTSTSTAHHSSTTNGAHQRRRWSAAHAIGNENETKNGNGNGNTTKNGTTKRRSGGDQPIGMVARKLSSTYLITVASG